MANDELSVLKKQLEDLITKMRLSKDTTRLLREQIDALKQSGTATADQIETLTKKLEKQYNQSIKFANEAKRIQNQILKIYPEAPVMDEQKIKKIAKEAEASQRKLNKQFAELRGSFTGETLYFFHKQIQWYLSKAVSLQVLELPVNILTSMTELNKVFTELGVLTRALPSDFEKLKSAVISVSKATSFSVSEVGATAKFLAQSGLDSAQIVNALQPIADLAIATSAKIEDAAKAVSTVLVAMDMPANQAGKVADILAQSTNLARLNIEDLSTSFNYTAAAAAQLGIPIDKLTSYLAILSNQGLRASTAATGLRQVFEVLQAPSEKAIKTLAKYGLTVEDVSPVTHDLVTILQKLGKVAKDDLAEIFSTRGGNAILALLNAGSQAIQMMETNINKQGIAAQMAREQMLTLENAYKQFLNTVQTTLGLSGEKLASPPLVDMLTGFNKSLQDIISNKASLEILQRLFNLIIGLGVAFGPFILSTTILKTVFGALKDSVSKVIDAYKSFTNVINSVKQSINSVNQSTNAQVVVNSKLKELLQNNVNTSLNETAVKTNIVATGFARLTAISKGLMAALAGLTPNLVVTGISLAISAAITWFIQAKQQLGELINYSSRVSSEFSRLRNEIIQGLTEEISLQNKLTQTYMQQYPELVKLNQEKAKLKFIENRDRLIQDLIEGTAFKDLDDKEKLKIRVTLSAAVDYRDLQTKFKEIEDRFAEAGSNLLKNIVIKKPVYRFNEKDFVKEIKVFKEDRETLAKKSRIHQDFVDQIKVSEELNSIIKSREDQTTKLQKLSALELEVLEAFKNDGKKKIEIQQAFEKARNELLEASNNLSDAYIQSANTIADTLNNIDNLIQSRTKDGITFFSSGDLNKYTQEILSIQTQLNKLNNEVHNTIDPNKKAKMLATISDLQKKYSELTSIKINVEADPKKLDDFLKKVYSYQNLSNKFTFFKNLIDLKTAQTDLQKLYQVYHKSLNIFTQLSTIATKSLSDSTVSLLQQTIGNMDTLIQVGTKKINIMQAIAWLNNNKFNSYFFQNGKFTDQGIKEFQKTFNMSIYEVVGVAQGSAVTIDNAYSSLVNHLTKYIGDGVNSAKEGINKLTSESGKAVDTLKDKIRELAQDIKDLPLLRLIDKKTLNETNYFYEVYDKVLKMKNKNAKAEFAKTLGISTKELDQYAKWSKDFKDLPLTVDQIKRIQEASTNTKTSKDVLDTDILQYIDKKLKLLRSKADSSHLDKELIEFLETLEQGFLNLRNEAIKGFDKIIDDFDKQLVDLEKNDFVKLFNETKNRIKENSNKIIDQLQKVVPNIDKEALNKRIEGSSSDKLTSLKKELESTTDRVKQAEIYRNILLEKSAIQQRILKEELKKAGVNQQKINDLLSKYEVLTAQITSSTIDQVKLKELQNIENLYSVQLSNILNQNSNEYLDLQNKIKKLQIDRQIEEAKTKDNSKDITKELEKQKQLLDQQLAATKAARNIDIFKLKSQPIGTQLTNEAFFTDIWKSQVEARSKNDVEKLLEVQNKVREYAITTGEFQGIPKSLLDEQKRLAENIKNTSSKINEGADPSVYEKLKTSLDELTSQYEALNDVINMFNLGAAENVDFLATAYNGVKSGFKSFANEVAASYNTMSVAADITKKGLDMIADGITNAITDMIMSGKSLEESFKDMFKNIGTMILQTMVRMMAMRAVFGTMGFFFMDKGGIVSPEGEVPVKKYATGGIARKTQVAVFGEGAMPEAFVPLPNGRSIPVQMKGAASVNQTNIQIIDQRGKGAPVQTEKSQGPNGEEIIKFYIRDEVRSAVAKGQFDNTFKDAYGVTRSPIRR